MFPRFLHLGDGNMVGNCQVHVFNKPDAALPHYDICLNRIYTRDLWKQVCWHVSILRKCTFFVVRQLGLVRDLEPLELGLVRVGQGWLQVG